MSLWPATSALIVFLCLEGAAHAAKVYVLKSGDAQSDQAVQTTLEQRGHTVTMGPVSVDFTGNQANLGSFDVTLLLYPSDGNLRMQVAGTAALRSHLINGGRLITGEWFNGSFGESSDLRPLLPVTRTGNYYTGGQTTFAKAEPDALLDDGVSETLTFNISGEDALVASADTKIYFTSRRSTGPGLVGKTLAGGGRILCFATSITSSELQNADFRRLLGNAVNWATVPYSPPPPNPAEAARVYLLRSGDADTDREVQRVLTERGHSVTTGPVSIDFTGSQANLGSFDVTLLLYPSDGNLRMQVAGTAALRTYLNNGGSLITGEWFNGSFGESSNLRSLLPVTRTGNYFVGGQTTFAKSEPDALIDDGLSDTFTFNISGENAFIVPAAAKIYFASRRSNAPGLVGNVLAGGGKVLCFSTSIGALEVQNPDFRRLLGNAINWAKPPGAPPPPPSVSITPASLSFSFTTSGSPPASQTLALTSPGASLDFTATASTNLGGTWLSVSPASGTTPATLSVTVTPNGLTPGTYTGEVAIVSGATSHIPVTLTVAPGSVCTYTLSPLTVNFTAAGGAGDIGVSTQTGCAWTATANATWITVGSGGSGSGPGTVHYTVAANTGAASRPGTLTAGGQQFSINQAGSALSFIVGPSPLTFRFTQGDTASAERTLYINPSASGATFSMTAAGGTWLSANPNSGIVPGAVIVTVNPSGLAAGTYRGSITVRIPNASPTDQIVPVEVTIESAGAPQLGIDSSTINFTATKGGHADTRKLQVLNRGSGTVVFRTAASGGSWLSVQPDSGTATVASPATLVVTANPQGLEAGTYTGRVLVTPASGDPVGVDVFFTVSAVNRTMLLSQSGLTFTAVAQGGAVPSQNFGILNTAEGVMDWSAAASTLAGGPWLSVTPNRGSTDAASLDVPLADVNINAAGLAPGEYHGLLTVSSSTAANSPQLVSILLRVLPPGSDPGPVVRPTGLIFTAAAGSAATGTQEVLVSTLAASSRNFTSSRLTYDGASWFTHLPVASTVAPSQPTRILVQANAASLQPGVRRGVLTLLFGDGAVQNVSILSLVATPPVPALSKNSVSAASSCGTPALQVQPTSLRNDFTAVVGQATTIAVKAADECGRLLDKTGLVTVRFSTGEPSITLANLGGGNWTATWRPVRAIGSVAMEISAFSFDVPISRGGRALLTGSVADTSQLPLVTAGGIVQAASFARGLPLAPGSLVTVYGSNLADGESRADGLPLPNELNHVQVVLGDRSLPLLYTSSGQVNVQVPYSLPVNTQHQIAVRRGTVLSVPETLSVAAAQPGIFTQNQNGLGQGVILRADGVTLAGPDSPAAVGETVVVYCTGLGNVDPPVSEGTAAPSRAGTTNPVTLRIGGVEAQVVFSGLAPENVGLYRVEAVVPQVTPGDAVSVQIEVAGQISPPVTMAIR